VADHIFQVDCFRIGGYNSSDYNLTDWIDLPIDSVTNQSHSTVFGQGYLRGLLIRAEGISDAKYCVAGVRIDGNPSVGYLQWPSDGLGGTPITPSLLSGVTGSGAALGTNTPYQLIKSDLANNAFVLWADFPYSGWAFFNNARFGARLVQRDSSGGNLFVWVAVFFLSRPTNYPGMKIG